MAKRILILDDDPDFTCLLTDIFRQTDYEPVPHSDPREALPLLRSEHFDLLITDHRMPGMTGEMLVRELRKTHPRLPVIVVSGFLDNDTIRDLIRDGVGGIFLKPLNVQNLLKRTAVLLNDADAAGHRFTPESAEEQQHHKLPFSFESFPCLTARTAEFANQLYAKRGFKGTLTLITPPGTRTDSILEDFAGFEPGAFKVFGPQEISEQSLLAALSDAPPDGPPTTLVLQDLDRAAPADRAPVIALGARRAPFDATPNFRLLFTFTHPVDELFEKGRIDEGLYLLSSVTEVRVPQLADCVEEIPVIATRILARYCSQAGIDPPLRLHKLAHQWLKEHPWPGNHEELSIHILRAAETPQSGVITRDAFTRESHEHQWIDSPSGISSLETYLRRLRDDCVQGALILCEGDTTLAGEALGVPPLSLVTHPLARHPGDASGALSHP